MYRETFIKKAIKFGAFGTTNWVAKQVVGGTVSDKVDKDNDRVLVLIQLVGGNDGLNTIIPINYWDQLLLHRGNVLPNKKM
jgi:uncharacterized protein (DUF1501 family)